MAWQLELDDRCPGCGTQSWQEGMHEPVRVTCVTCAQLDVFRAEQAESTRPRNPGMHVMLRRRKA